MRHEVTIFDVINKLNECFPGSPLLISSDKSDMSVLISVGVSVSQNAVKMLDEFDDEWWLDHCTQIPWLDVTTTYISEDDIKALCGGLS